MKKPEFKELYAQAKADILKTATAKLQGNLCGAIDTLAEIMTDTEAAKQTRVNSGCQLHFKWNFNDSLSNYGGFNWNYNTGFTSLGDNGYVCRGHMGAYMKVVSTFVPPTPCASRTYFYCPNGGFDTKIYPNTGSAPCTIISHFYTGTSNCIGTWDHAFSSELSPPGNPKCQVYNALTDELISEYCNSNDDPRYKNDGYRYSEGQKIQYEYCYPNCQ